MSIIIDTTTLSGSLQWVNRYSWSPVALSTKRTLGGTLVTFSQQLSKGQPIQLVANEETGWFTKVMVDAITTLSSQVGSQFTFDFHGETHTVMFDHTNGSAISFAPLVRKVPHVGTDYFIGTINLFTV